MCFLYELHEYIELLKEKYNFDEKISNDIEDVESNIIDIYYNNNIYNLKEQINTICSQLTIEASEAGDKRYNIIKEMKENIIDIYGINKKKKKEYYSYICDIKNIIIE
jgi:hypothetical protein|uniref:Uncharacterized protein n=1 Tax=viral metagenome TaxID=1070528 RepID=A0A6C0LEL9_9ZZZZ